MIMEKNKKRSIIILGFVSVALCIPLAQFAITGSMINPDDVSISHNDVFSGDNNIIHIEANFSVQEIFVSLNETKVEYSIFEDSGSMEDLPIDLFTSKGDQTGELEDLEDEDDSGIEITSEWIHWCWHNYHYSRQYAVFDTDMLEEASNIKLNILLSSNDDIKSKIYYFDYKEEEWVKINEEYMDSSNHKIIVSYDLSGDIVEEDSIMLMLTGYDKWDSFEYLIDQMVIEYSIPSSFDDDISIDVSEFDDGQYVLDIEILDFGFNTFKYNKVIYIDNSAPVINIIDFPCSSKVHNTTEILIFETIIEDFSDTNTILVLDINGSEYITLDFDGSKSISYQNNFIPGNYSYTLISEDSNGLFSSYSGSFEVEFIEQDPVEVLYENTVMINIPESVDFDAMDYPINIEVIGVYNIEYQCNLSYTSNSTLINSLNIYTNNSDSIISDVFNISITLDIYSLNSTELIFTRQFAVFKNPLIEHFITDRNNIYVNIPSSVNYTTTEYSITIETEGNFNDTYNCNVTYVSNGTLIDSLTIYTNDTEILISNVFNESINLMIYNINDSNLAVDKNYYIEKIPLYEYYHIYENKIVITLPESVNEHVMEYPIYIDISGDKLYDYKCDIENTSTIICTDTISTNNSGIIMLDIFNTSFTLKILNIQESNALVYEENYTVIKFLDIHHYEIITIDYPDETKDSGYNIDIYAYSDDASAIFEYKISNAETSVIIDSGPLVNGEIKTVYADVFEESILVEVIQNGQVVYTADVKVEKFIKIQIQEKKTIDYNLIFVILTIIGLTLSMIGLFYSILRGKKMEERQERFERQKSPMSARRIYDPMIQEREEFRDFY